MRYIFMIVLGLLIGCDEHRGGGHHFGEGPPAEQPSALPEPVKASAPATAAPKAQPRVTLSFAGGVSSQRVPVDVVFVVDSSSSLAEERGILSRAMATFAAGLASAQSFDTRIYVLVSGDLATAANAPGVILVNKAVGSHDGLLAAVEFAQGKYNALVAGGIFPRPEAHKEFVIVSDDDAHRVTAATLAAQAASGPGLKRYRVNAFIGLPANTPGTISASAQSDSCRIAAAGTEYVQAATASGGTVGDICLGDWLPVLTRVAQNLQVVDYTREFVLAPAANPASEIVVSVDGAKQPPGSFRYEPATFSLIFVDPPKENQRVDVNYQPL